MMWKDLTVLTRAFLILLLPPLLLSDNQIMQFPVSRGRCVIAQGQQQQLAASSALMCAFLCSQLRPCISWSYRTGICNVSDSVQTHLLTNVTDCEWWSALHQLSHVAFWPMSNVTRTRNVVSDSGYLDLHENRVMQYAGDAVNFTGQFDVDERYNIDQLASVCLFDFTMSVWVKVINPSRGPMPLLEGSTASTDLFTRLWLYPDCTKIEFTAMSPVSLWSVTNPPITPNVWTHITGVYVKQPPRMDIYVNGTKVTTVTATSVSGCVTFGANVTIGAVTRSASHNRVFQGYMKCFGVSDRALSNSEVTQLSQACQHENSP